MKSKIKILSCISLVILLLFSLMCPSLAYEDTYYDEYEFYSNEDAYYSGNEPDNKDTSSTYRAYSDGYYIESYNVDINITKENVFQIEETIEAYFDPDEYKHGIIRDIPLYSKVTREDGSSDNKYANIKNMRMTDENGEPYNYEQTISSKMASYKIGSANKYVAGRVVYKISYDYHLSGDTITDADEVYFNIIGTEWSTFIYNVTFSITTPDPIDADTLGFSIGSEGSVGYNSDELKYEVNGNTLTGEYNERLLHEGITIRCLFPEGYFEIPVNIRDYLNIISLIIPLIFTAIAIVLKIAIRRKNKVIEVIEFYPPDNLHSLDIAHIFKGEIRLKDIFSLMLYCASKGYVEITEDLCTGNFSFTYIKKYDGNNEIIEMFLNKLFKHPDTTLSMDEVAEDFEKVVCDIELKYKHNKQYIAGSNGKSKYLTILSLASLMIGAILPTIITRDITFVIFLFIYCFATFMLRAAITSMRNAEKGEKIFNVLVLGFMLFVLIVFLSILAIMCIFFNIGNALPVVALVLAIIIAIMKHSAIERTSEGVTLYGRILGFKRFLETAEKEKLETLVEETPTYFYDILPYTYVLGISDKWIEKFDDIAIDREMNTYKMSTYDFNSTFKTLDKSFNTAYSVAHPDSSSSSGSSGGGSSGGGSGGGGGSSW